ncbi:hypothetical protein [Streptomyces sp. MZ04]|uniref:hypothetical protein n=1 Tax=Streptomyces sp. MZ04 TaxID=2559236 RepID=UPI00107EC179|nr:hypothetical protein [Streptomyces sp. MZ04]TGB15496.1 hypothetical protein E2651_02405 [Streptomyces sp. MZ04]
MPTAVVPDVTAALIAYRRSTGDTWVTLVDVTSDLMHLASYMRTDIERCLEGDANARLDERAFSAMPNLHPSVEPIANADETASDDHCFDHYVHASDAAAVLLVHTSEETHSTFSAALNKLLSDLRAFAEQNGFSYADVVRSARTSYRIEQKRAR